MFSAYLYGKFFSFTRYPDNKYINAPLNDFLIDKHVLLCHQDNKTIKVALGGGLDLYEAYLCVGNETIGPIAICGPGGGNLHLTNYAIENGFKLNESLITVPLKYFDKGKVELTSICDFCEQFDNDNLNFCGYCGKGLAKTGDQILRNKLKKIFIDKSYIYFYSQLDESLKYLFPFSITDLNKKNREHKKKNLNQNDSEVITIRDLERYNPIYGLEMEEVFVKIFELKFEDIYIIDISELEFDWCLQKKRLPTCKLDINTYQLDINQSIIFAKINKINIYTKKEYEEKVHPFLKYCPGWLEKSFYYRDLNPWYVEYFGIRKEYTEKFIPSNFIPFIKDKVYIISSAYSNFLKQMVENVAETRMGNLGENNLNFGIEINYRIGKFELSGFNFTPKTIGKVNEKYLPIVMATLAGFEIEPQNNDNKDECCICLEQTSERLECNHPVHKACLEKNSAKNCPICQNY